MTTKMTTETEKTLEEKTKTLIGTSKRTFKTEPREIYLTADQSLEGYTLFRVALVNGQKYNGFASRLIKDEITKKLYEIIETSIQDLPRIREELQQKNARVDFALTPDVKKRDSQYNAELQKALGNKNYDFCNGEQPNFSKMMPLLNALSSSSASEAQNQRTVETVAKEVQQEGQHPKYMIFTGTLSAFQK